MSQLDQVLNRIDTDLDAVGIETPYLAEEAVSDTSELGPIVASVVEANPKEAEAYRAGKEGLLGFFVGQVMRETHGKADPRVVNELVRKLLAG